MIQPQIQKRAVALQPFVTLVSVMFGGTLFGVIGAILAVPTAATIQIAFQEWATYRGERRAEAVLSGDRPSLDGPPPPVVA